MAVKEDVIDNKLAHYRAWSRAWLDVGPSTLPTGQCMAIFAKLGPLWLQEQGTTDNESMDLMHVVISCFKAATKAQLVPLDGRKPPSRDEYNVLSENYDARVECKCDGIFPVSSSYDKAQLNSCGCAAIERMIDVGNLVNDKEDEWNNSTFFTQQGLSLAMTELVLCHADTEPSALSCHGEKQGSAQWPEVRAPDRKPDPDLDLDKDTYRSLFPTNEQIRLSADAKYFFAIATGASIVDPGIQMAIADSGNDILIADYCDAATENCLESLQKEGAAAFSFLKLCVYAGRMTDWQFDLFYPIQSHSPLARPCSITTTSRGVWYERNCRPSPR